MTFRFYAYALALLLPTLSAMSLAQEQDKPERQNMNDRRGPPQEAFDACNGLTEEAACSVETPHGHTISGLCRRPPQLDSLVCVPDGHRPGAERPPE